MITAKEARQLYIDTTSYSAEADRFIKKLDDEIRKHASAGGVSRIIKMPTNNVVVGIITETLKANGYGWHIYNMKGHLILQVWW